MLKVKRSTYHCENVSLNKELERITRHYKLRGGRHWRGAKRRRRGIEGHCKGVEGLQLGVKVRLGVLKVGMEGSTGRRGSVKWQWESVKEQWGSVKVRWVGV